MKWSKKTSSGFDIPAAAVPEWFKTAKGRGDNDDLIMQETTAYCQKLMEKRKIPDDDPRRLKYWAELLFDMYNELYEKASN